MGWRDRDYARWTDEERRRYLDSDVSVPARSAGRGSLPRLRVAHGAGAAILVSAALLILGQLPRNHPLLPSFHVRLPSLRHEATKATSFHVSAPRLTKLRGPRAARVGGTLTVSGSNRTSRGPVAIQGTYGRSWKTLSTLEVDGGGDFRVTIPLTRRGLLHIRVLYPDGSRAVGSTRVR